MGGVGDLALELDMEELVVLALLDCAANTLVPEIVGIFGHDAGLRFLEVFAGTTITVPPPGTIKNAAIHAAIWRRLREGEEVDDLAVEFGLDVHEVDAINENMSVVVAGAAPHLETRFARKKRR